MVNERVEQMRLELQAQNDSIINEMAIYRADSIIAARTGKAAPSRPKPSAPPANSRSTETIDEVEEAQPRNPKAGRFDGNEDNTTKKESRFDKDAADKEKEAKKDKKAERFNK